LSLDHLSIEGVRNLRPARLDLAPGVNWFHGENGAGKTSLLEAVFVLGRGRGFRLGPPTGVIQHGCRQLRVVAERSDGTVLGLERSFESWRGRIDGRETRRISEFAVRLPLVLIEPDSHRLIDGPPGVRRQHIDWQLFHVEPTYLHTWQRFARSLKQRNAALRAGHSDGVLDAIAPALIESAEEITRLRREQTRRLQVELIGLAKLLELRLPGDIRLDYRPGFPPAEDLATSLEAHKASDRERGFTQRGPHRADLVLTCAGRAAARELSRGQQKLLAVLLLLAQLRLLTESGAPAPVLLLDDPVSELDRVHLRCVLDWLIAQPFQSFVTATETATINQPTMARSITLFHVEHGTVRPGEML